MSKKNLTWLWLSERPEDHTDIEETLEGAGINYEMFPHVCNFTEKLFEIKSSETENFENYGLISSVHLTGQAMVMSPKELNGKDDFYFKTNNETDAGFIFYKNLILGNSEKKVPSIWLPNSLPPTIFLSIHDKRYDFVQRNMKEIETKWAELNHCSPDQAKVKYINKWNYDPVLVNTLKELEK
jgi:hypothetical protein